MTSTIVTSASTNLSSSTTASGTDPAVNACASAVLDNSRSYARSELHVLNLLNHPIWVFDIINKSVWWGNTSAIEYWNADSLEELINRNFADDMSEARHKKNLDTLERVKRNERVEESVSIFLRPSSRSRHWHFVHVSQTHLTVLA